MFFSYASEIQDACDQHKNAQKYQKRSKPPVTISLKYTDLLNVELSWESLVSIFRVT